MSQFFVPHTVDGEVVDTRQRRDSRRFRVSVRKSDLPSRTKQADAKSADINFIVARYKKTGELPVSKRAPLFEDISTIDFKESMDLLTRAEQSFGQLPAATRAAYNNDPMALLADLDDRSPEAHRRLFAAGMLTEDYVDPEAVLTQPKGSKASQGPSSSKGKGSKGSKEPELPMEDEG